MHFGNSERQVQNEKPFFHSDWEAAYPLVGKEQSTQTGSPIVDRLSLANSDLNGYTCTNGTALGNFLSDRFLFL